MLKVLWKKKTIILLVIVLVWSTLFATDFILAGKNQRPIFAFQSSAYEDGGSGSFFGLGYRVNVYFLCLERDKQRVEIGTWFMPFRHPNLIAQNDYFVQSRGG